jgi:hypothetical protein
MRISPGDTDISKHQGQRLPENQSIYSKNLRCFAKVLGAVPLVFSVPQKPQPIDWQNERTPGCGVCHPVKEHGDILHGLDYRDVECATL